MKLTIGWADGERKTVYDVTTFDLSHTDEFVLSLTFRDGERDIYTGKDLRVTHGEEIDGTTQVVEE